MAFAQSVVLGSSAFLLGMVFVCQVVDIPLLYIPVTQQALDNAYTFYEIWFEAPGAVKALFHVALGLPMVALLVKMHKWSESAMFFDGTSIVLHLITIIMYITVHISALRTFLPESTTTTSFSIFPNPPPREKPATEAERIEAVRVLAAGNAIVGLLTIGVIAMQVGQEYAAWLEARQQAELNLQAAAVVKNGTESKKDI